MPTHDDAEKTDESPVTLSAREEEEVEQRTPPRAAVVFETVRREGEVELERPALSLVASGLAAGLSMGASLAAVGIVMAHLPDAPWRPLVAQLGYTIGFLIVVMGRQQLFTENTVTVVLPLLAHPDKFGTLGKIARLWALVLASNIVGAIGFAFAVAHSGVFTADVKAAFDEIGRHAAAAPWGDQFTRGIFAGWLIALMVWLLPASGELRPFIIIIITYVVGIADLSHIVAGSIEVLYTVALGETSWAAFFGGFFAPVLLGNIVGGVALVALLNYGQVVSEGEPA